MATETIPFWAFLIIRGEGTIWTLALALAHGEYRRQKAEEVFAGLGPAVAAQRGSDRSWFAKASRALNRDSAKKTMKTGKETKK